MKTPPESELRALREAVALSEMNHVLCVRGAGPEAFEALDTLCSGDLFVQDGQMIHTLLLRDNGEPFADLYVCCDDEDAILFVEGPDMDSLLAHFSRHIPSDLAPEWQDLGRTHQLVSINGPYAWELTSALVGPDVVGLPYRTFFHVEHGICFRAGKTGEFGYDLLIERDHARAALDQLEDAGARLDVRHASLDALDQCALENNFFSIRAGPFDGLTPVELQLQWRLSNRKPYVGSDAVRARQAAPTGVQATCFATQPGVVERSVVCFGSAPIGHIHAIGYSPVRGDAVGHALLQSEYACASISRYHVEHAGDLVPLHTLSAPMINNRSLYVDPRNDSYRTRAEHDYPPIG